MFLFRYDPTTFRDQIVAGLNEANEDLELVSKFLIQSGSKLDFRRYSEALFDVLITGIEILPCYLSPFCQNEITLGLSV